MYKNSGAVLKLENTQIEKGLDIYPNPTIGKLFISSQASKVVKAQLFDITGRIVQNIKATTSMLDITNLPKGIYMLKLSFKDTSIVKKVIKK